MKTNEIDADEQWPRLQGVFDGMWPMLQRYIEGDAGDIELAARLEGYFLRLREGDVVGAALAEAERHFEQCSEAFLDDRTTDAAYHVGCAREALRPLYRTPTIEEWAAVVRDQRRAMRDMGVKVPSMEGEDDD